MRKCLDFDSTTHEMSGETLELHIWGPVDGLPSFSPECLAAVWYLDLTAKELPVSIVQSSNPSISYSGAYEGLSKTLLTLQESYQH